MRCMDWAILVGALKVDVDHEQFEVEAFFSYKKKNDYKYLKCVELQLIAKLYMIVHQKRGASLKFDSYALWLEA